MPDKIAPLSVAPQRNHTIQSMGVLPRLGRQKGRRSRDAPTPGGTPVVGTATVWYIARRMPCCLRQYLALRVLRHDPRFRPESTDAR